MQVTNVKLQTYPGDLESPPQLKKLKDQSIGPFCANCGNSDLFLEERLSCIVPDDSVGRAAIAITDLCCNNCEQSNMYFLYDNDLAVNMDQLVFIISHKEDEYLIDKEDESAIISELLLASGAPDDITTDMDDWFDSDDSEDVDDEFTKIIMCSGNSDYSADYGDTEELEEEWCKFIKS